MAARTRRLRDYATLYLKGVAMGAADVIPGVSGGTMALILGIYRELIAALGAFSSGPVLGALGRGRLVRAWRLVGGDFLLVLAAGIATSVLTLSGVIVAALTGARSLVFALFFGLVLASVVTVGRRVGRWNAAPLTALLFGAAFGFWLVGLTPASTPDGVAFLALSGALAICALVLPGISGAFVLVLLGKYEHVLTAIAELDFATLLPVALGAGTGLLAFARLLAWLLARAERITLALLSGFMLGSLRKIWPWQSGDEFAGRNLWPPDLGAALTALVLALIGAGLVLGLDRLGQRRSGAAPGSER